ncbi:MAG: VOC family protein, partial [Acidobacteria bacterium]|nr:VOC family protein [Acidobacteriota bacterium]
MAQLPSDAHIGEVTIGITDLDRSLAFYTDVLGFVVHARDDRSAALGADGGRTIVRLEELPQPEPRPRRASGLYHFAILVPSRAALGRSLRRLAITRWPITGVADHLVSEAVYLDDPDGLGIEIYRDRPRESWALVAPGEYAMATDPLDVEAIMAEPGADAPWSGLDAGTVMGHVHLHVPDLATAEAFYGDEIGFTPVVRRYPGALFVSAGGYHHHVGLNIWAGRGAPPPPVSAPGMRRFTIEARQIEPRERFDADT